MSSSNRSARSNNTTVVTNMKFPICAILGLLVAASCFSATEPLKDIRNVLTRTEFISAGLEKLTEAELVQLSGSLYGWKEIEAAPESSESEEPARVTMQEEAQFGAEKLEKPDEVENSPKEIESRILGDFRGWKGRTVFRLENGQVWRQTDKKSYYLVRKDPEVVIRKGALGSYFLSVKGERRRCKVERIK
jgi:hypothetical protein